MSGDNRDFWREYAEYIQVSEAVIQIQFVLHNRSEVQLSNAKLEVLVEPQEGQTVHLLAGSDLPEEPSSKHDFTRGIRTLPQVLASQNRRLIVDENGNAPRCLVRFGSLLPGEEGWSDDTFAIVPSAPGKLLLRFRILAGELTTPIQMERVIEATGSIESLDFSGFMDFVRTR